MTIMNEFKRHKAGIFIGAITGAVAAAYAIGMGYADLTSIATAGKGAIDSLFARQAATTVATYKVYMVFVSLGALIGYITDKVVSR